MYITKENVNLTKWRRGKSNMVNIYISERKRDGKITCSRDAQWPILGFNIYAYMSPNGFNSI